MRSETLYSNGIFLYFMQKYKYRLNILPERIIIRTVRIFGKGKGDDEVQNAVLSILFCDGTV